MNMSQRSAWLLEDAEAALSPDLFAILAASLHAIAPNPFPEGREWQEQQWWDGCSKRARRLVWC